MENKFIRPLALAIIKKDDSILVQVGFDSKKNQKFYRIPGGGIEFGETGIMALNREFMEEFGSKINNIELLGFVENIFTYEGESGHELVVVYKADLVKESLYHEEEIRILDNDESYAIWENIDVLKNKYFYPNGINKFV
ncbi:MAG: NUDIX hydrolase [Parcubacteria group bacterium CG10_big_fil_rev_8_21_14_0_10_38_31]|nr:MAG: NUDIX hydrolase [Parcubacteria group bacterium CG10_big_fil_rev_8_21_14_0_10_38_31]